jgi:hypothetical protein
MALNSSFAKEEELQEEVIKSQTANFIERKDMMTKQLDKVLAELEGKK